LRYPEFKETESRIEATRGFGKIPWRRAWQPTPVFFLGEPHGQRSLVGCSPWGCKELDVTERLSTHTGMDGVDCRLY